MEIIIGIISGLFWPALFVLGIVWVIKKASAGSTTDYVVKPTLTSPSDENSVRQKIAAEIRAQAGQYKTAAQKQVVEEMAQTVEYFALHGYQVEPRTQVSEVMSPPVPAQSSIVVADSAEYAPEVTSAEDYETPWKKLQVLDGATILLYLGAFFLLASIGLYVGFGEGASIKAVLVAILTGGFYVAGLYLNQYTQRLKPVGGTFAAIGMASLPMAGAAMYYFALDKTSGPAVWLITSVACIVLYVHAVNVFRSTLVSYMIVFSTLSVVLSSITSLGLTAYYFIQGIGFAGIAFVLVSRLMGRRSGLVSEAYERSASFMIPFSVALSVLFIVRVGWLQLATSLLLGAAYYGYLATETNTYRATYALLSQLLAILALLSGVFGIGESGLHIAIASSFVSGLYGVLWLVVYAKKPVDNVYRRQIKYIYLALPFLALVAMFNMPTGIWWVVSVIAIEAISVYLYERDEVTGGVASVAVLALPVILSYLTFVAPMSDITMALLYTGLAALSMVLRAIMGNRLGKVDLALQQFIYGASLSVASMFMLVEDTVIQSVFIVGVLALFIAQSFIEESRSLWLTSTAVLHLVYALFLFDVPKLLLAFTVLHVTYNVILVATKKYGSVHSWLAVTGVLLVPLLYGETVAQPDWGWRPYLLAYALVFIITFSLRAAQKLINALALSYGYLIALLLVIGSGIADTNTVGLLVIIAAISVFYLAEKVENSRTFGLFAPFIGLLYLFSDQATVWNYVTLLSIVMLITAAVSLARKRMYEAYVSFALLSATLWYSLSELTELSVAQKMYIFFGLAATGLVIRFVCVLQKSYIADPAMLFYTLVTGIGIGYLILGSGLAVAVGLFILGCLITAMSYLERQPILIVPALLLGFSSILRLAISNDLSVTATALLVIFVCHVSYWLLVLSRLATVRAGYARVTLISVAAAIPIVGLFYSDNSVFPLSLALFGGVLLREIWTKGQSAREVAALSMHAALLWWLYVVGVRELQVYTQLSALLFGGFAYARRYLKDSPAVINQYLWLSVLTFTLPMVWQALTSSNANYSYLLLFEHILLIVISILYRRSTFAWWGIIVVVAAVLYQLRELRYAALAFLGVFIISLAVYFLLRYNKPDEGAKSEK